MSIRFKGKRETRYGKRHKPGVMNRIESEYSEILEGMRKLGQIEQWHFESHTFKIADNTRYTPDFSVLFPDGSMEFIDTKADYRIDPASIVKIKCAADKFPQFAFAIMQKLSKKNAGKAGVTWKRTNY